MMHQTRVTGLDFGVRTLDAFLGSFILGEPQHRTCGSSSRHFALVLKVFSFYIGSRCRNAVRMHGITKLLRDDCESSDGGRRLCGGVVAVVVCL